MASTSVDSSDGGKKQARPDMLRRQSMIIPSTGARVHDRNFTLSPAIFRDAFDGPTVDETTSLLHNAHTQRRHTHDRYAAGEKAWRLSLQYLEFVKSRKAKTVIKCSLAYFLGSLATFVTPVSQLLGHYDGKHMVATCATYFHPGRTVGSMHQATLFALTAFLYSTVVSIGSMAMSTMFARWDLINLGHALVLVIFCFGGLGLIAYAKQTMASPTVSVACSLASISIITILTKEGSVQMAQFEMGKIYQVSMIVVMAIVISNCIAFVLWPTSAVKELRQLMIVTTDNFSESLTSLTHSFLNASESTRLVGAASNTAHQKAVFGPLLKNLAEAKYEHYVWGSEKEYQQEVLLVQSMQRLSQNIGGLRSAAATQLSLLREAQRKGLQTSGPVPMTTPVAQISPDMHPSNGPSQLFTPPDNVERTLQVERPIASWISTPASGRSIRDVDMSPEEQTDGTTDEEPAPIMIFEQFLYHLGPPMKSLVWTLKLMLDDLPFGPAPSYRTEINPNFRGSLRKASILFSEKRALALHSLYRNEAITRARSVEDAADVEEVAASCSYFSSCLQYFAEEMATFLEILTQLQHLQETKPRTWEWLKFWKRSERKLRRRDSEEGPFIPNGKASAIKRQPTVPNVSPEDPIPFSYRVWKCLRVFRKDSIKFAVKVGFGAAVYALPSFIPSTRPIYSLWRGEWGLVSYMIVMSMTVGQTNNSGEARVLGTVFGALLALIAWIVFPENPYALSIFGWLVSLPCFWIILNWKQATFGRFILLTYNISALYAYSLSMADDDDDDDEGGINPIITDIVLHRFVAVILGVVWAMIVNRLIWPISARTQLRKGLSVLWLRMALIWNRDPLNCLINGMSDKHYMNITEEHSLEKDLLRLNSILGATPHELRLKGPFPVKEYQNILKATQGILDAFHGMSVMISKDPKANRREAEILEHTSKERGDLCARIAHLFYVLGSSIRLGFPLPESLPNTVRARDRLLAKLFDYRNKLKHTADEVDEVDEDFALIYAYALVTARISEGLDECIRNVELLYGVLEEEQLEI